MQDNINKDSEEKVTNEPKENIEEVNESSGTEINPDELRILLFTSSDCIGYCLP